MTVDNNLKVYKTEKVVIDAIDKMAHKMVEITPDMGDTVFIIILKGGLFVGMELLKYWNNYFGLIGLSSYGEKTESSKKVVYNSMLDLSPDFLKDKDVWLIDDVAQTGATFTMAVRILVTVGARSIHTAALVRKSAFGNFEPDVVGIRYPDKKFLVGCGMGLGEEYRTLPYLAELLKE